MSIDRKAARVLERARTISRKVDTWADFSNAMFDQFNGVVPKEFPSELERQAFFDTEQYKQILQIQTELMKKHGTVVGAAPKSGKFVVRVPKTIHQKLDIESKREGVSLNQLALTKLSVPLPRSTGVAEETVIESFNSTHEGYARDWVVIDPRHNSLFLERCRKLGLRSNEYSDFRLNHLLMNIGKTKKYKGRLNEATKKSGFKSYNDCAFAAEIAIRTLQRTDGVTLDRILCDPELRSRFDTIAMKMAPGHTEIKLRCAAFNLRKTHRLKPIDLSADEINLVAAGPIKKLPLAEISAMPGLYAFFDKTRPLFAGETDNLQERIQMHLNGGLPDWFDKEDEAVILKLIVVPSGKREERLKWLISFINRERPLLNYQNTG